MSHGPPTSERGSLTGEPLLDYGPLTDATFVERPSRFIAICHIDGQRVRAHLANPGRLHELLFPGVRLSLQPSRDPQRATRYTVVALERDDEVIPLDTQAANRVAASLFDHGLVPGYESAHVTRREIRHGRHRFDLQIDHAGIERFVEVKSCTLFANNVAMFPDAVTERGRQHLRSLARIARSGPRPFVLFLVHTTRARYFMPDYHTDLAFSQTFQQVGPALDILPIGLAWNRNFTLATFPTSLEIPWAHLQAEIRDGGAYVLLLRLPRKRVIQTGALGELRFEPGWYLYIGSAVRGLDARIARHKRLRKRLHWHIDYLRRACKEVVALPIRSSRRDECSVAHAISCQYHPGPVGFGSSDCGCHSHLFYADTNPLHHPSFHRLIQAYRMRHPD